MSTLVSILLFRKRFQLSVRTKLLSMMLLRIIMREEYVLVEVAIISSFLSMCLKFWSYPCFTFLCKLILVPTSCLLTKSLCIGSGLDLNVLVIFFMMLPLCFNSYPLCEHPWNHHAWLGALNDSACWEATQFYFSSLIFVPV